MKRLLILILFISIFQSAAAQTWQDTVNTISHYFDRYNKPNRPGCQLAISLNGKMVLSKAWGLADLERNVPYTPETITEAGSITKQITAAATLLLEQQEKISLEDDVRKYLPEFPDYGHVIKLKYLLHHTSGIREWSDLEAITGWPRTYKVYNNEDVFNLLCRQNGLNNIPGTEYIYSNSNYLLLCMIIEKVSGMTLPDFTKKYIFDPTGMTHTSWRTDFKKIVPNRGMAYIKKDGHYIINMPTENLYGPGALLTTAEDLLKWTNYFFSNKLGNPGLLSKQLAVDKIPAELDYAAGLFIGKFRGYDIISHTGQTAGYIGAVETLPQLHLSVAWLSNTTEFKDSLYVGIDAIDNLYIKNASPEKVKKNIKAVAIPSEKLKPHLGWYRYAKTGWGEQITLRNDTLRFGNTPLIPVNETEFKYDDAILKFNASGGFILNMADKRKLVLTKEVTAKTSPDYLKQFTGTYYSKETESSFKLIVKAGKLMLEQNYLKDVELLPTYQNAFNFYLNVDSDMWPVPANILFEKGNNKTPNRCEVSFNDARGIKFVKVP